MRARCKSGMAISIISSNLSRGCLSWYHNVFMALGFGVALWPSSWLPVMESRCFHGLDLSIGVP